MASIISLTAKQINGRTQPASTGTSILVSPSEILQAFPKTVSSDATIKSEVRVRGLRKQADVYLVTSTVAQIETAANA